MKPLSMLALALVLAACGGGGADESGVVLFKPTGTLQCAPTLTTQARLDTEVAALRAAGVAVLDSRCAQDGAAHATLCGSEAGELFSVAVSSVSVPAAQALGFQPAGRYPGAQRMPCR